METANRQTNDDCEILESNPISIGNSVSSNDDDGLAMCYLKGERTIQIQTTVP